MKKLTKKQIDKQKRAAKIKLVYNELNDKKNGQL